MSNISSFWSTQFIPARSSKFLFIALVAISFTFEHRALAEKNESADRHRSLREFIEAELSKTGAAGIAIALIENGSVTYTEGFGVKRIGEDDPIGTDTLFTIASVTKTYTALAAMTLVRDGLLDMNAPVRKYVPYFGLNQQYDPDAILVKHVFTHTAGLASDPREFDPKNLPFDDTKPEALADFFKYFSKELLLVAPGKIWNYSNFGYSLAGLIVERAAKASFSSVVESRVLRPLGLKTTKFSNRDARVTSHVSNHAPDKSGQYIAMDPTLDIESYYGRPMSGLYASIRDMATLATVLLNRHEDFLAKQYITQIQTPIVNKGNCFNAYGYGIHIDRGYFNGVCNDEDLLIRAAGDLGGASAKITVNPSTGFGVAVATNDARLRSTLSRVIEKAFVLYTGKTKFAREDRTTDPQTWGSYTGNYMDSTNFGGFRVFQRNDKLFIYFEGPDEELEMTPYQDDFFLFVPPDRFLPPSWLPQRHLLRGAFGGQFVRSDTGNVQYFVTRIGVGQRTAERDSPKH